MTDQIPTKADYDAASPYVKGYLAYTYSAWPESTIPKENPFKKGTQPYRDFVRGQDIAMLNAQDSEE